MALNAECCYAECRLYESHKQDHYAECQCAECRYAECRYAECRGAFTKAECNKLYRALTVAVLNKLECLLSTDDLLARTFLVLLLGNCDFLTS